MRHPASSPLPCDPNKETSPSLITCKGEFPHLGCYCNTGTLTRDNALITRKKFFAKTYLRVLKHEENLFSKIENFLTSKIFGLDWNSCIAMRHPASSPLPCDPNRESPPSLIKCKGEFPPLGSHCNTGTLTRDDALISRKKIFSLKLISKF